MQIKKFNIQIVAYKKANGKNEIDSQCCHQLELFPLPKKRRKPQIVSVPGSSVRERDRYRVMLGDVVLGDNLSAPEALQLAKRLKKRKKFTESIELLESCGITSQEAQIFLLSEIGAIGGGK